MAWIPPRRVTSTATTITVQSGAGWGTGLSVGTAPTSVNGWTWTPARDGSGNVNLASWNTVPLGTWVKVASSSMSTITSLITAPGWDATTLAWNGTLEAWNGFAIDETGNRVWMMNAGGHSDSSNNGIYEFNFYKMAWRVERQPSDRTRWSEAYKRKGAIGSTFTNCDESAAEATRLGEPDANGFGWFYDEIYWDNPAINATEDVGVPTSRHVYGAPVYVPATNELIQLDRRLWKYSLTTGKYTYKRSNASIGGENVIGIYDEQTQEVLACYSNPTRQVIWDNANLTFKAASLPWSNYTASSADTRYGRDVTVVSFGNHPQSSYWKFWKYNLDSRTTVASGSITLYDAATASDVTGVPGVPSYGADGSALCYIPPEGKYWITCRTNSAPGISLFWFDIATGVLGPKVTFANALPTVSQEPTAKVMERKVVWMPQLNAVVFPNRDGFYVYKF